MIHNLNRNHNSVHRLLAVDRDRSLRGQPVLAHRKREDHQILAHFEEAEVGGPSAPSSPLRCTLTQISKLLEAILLSDQDPAVSMHLDQDRDLLLTNLPHSTTSRSSPRQLPLLKLL